MVHICHGHQSHLSRPSLLLLQFSDTTLNVRHLTLFHQSLRMHHVNTAQRPRFSVLLIRIVLLAYTALREAHVYAR